MCQIHNKTTDNMKCKCKQICCKMQNESLRCAIDALKTRQDSTRVILNTLQAISNLLEVYSCIPCTRLLERVNWVYRNIEYGNGTLYASEKIMVNMLISELKAFLGDS